jgi:hypothetical protein
MNRIDTITCKHCKQEVDVCFYFSNPRITTETDASAMVQCYTAIATAKTLCPLCGTAIEEVFQKTIAPGDIIKLAVRGS